MIATVERSQAAGVYLVRDQAGRLHRAMAPTTWKRGDIVLVVDGQIVGQAARPPQPQIYEV